MVCFHTSNIDWSNNLMHWINSFPPKCAIHPHFPYIYVCCNHVTLLNSVITRHDLILTLKIPVQVCKQNTFNLVYKHTCKYVTIHLKEILIQIKSTIMCMKKKHIYFTQSCFSVVLFFVFLCVMWLCEQFITIWNCLCECRNKFILWNKSMCRILKNWKRKHMKIPIKWNVGKIKCIIWM